MKTKAIAISLACIILLSIFCTVQLIRNGEPDEIIYNQASRINPSCADWCADLQWEKPDVSRECLERVIETGSCRSKTTLKFEDGSTKVISLDEWFGK